MREEEPGIVAQDAVLGEDEGYEAMPKVELTEYDLTAMQHRECNLLIDCAKTMLRGMIHRNEMYGTPYSKADIDNVIYWLDRAKVVLE